MASPDQTIVVMSSGEQEIEVFGNGTWRRALYRAGTIRLTPGGHVDRLRRRIRPGQGGFEKLNLYLPQAIFRQAAEHYRRAGQPVAERPLTSLGFNDPSIRQTVCALLGGMPAGLPDIYAETASCWLATDLLSGASGWLDGDAARPRTGAIAESRVARSATW